MKQLKPVPPVSYFGVEVLRFSKPAMSAAGCAALPTPASLPAQDLDAQRARSSGSLLNSTTSLFASSFSSQAEVLDPAPRTLLGYGAGCEQRVGWDPLWFARGFSKTAQENYKLLTQTLNELCDAAGK